MYKILDTNIVLEDASLMYTLATEGVTIVIPEVVLDEVDSKKTGFTELAWQAREFGRLLQKSKRAGIVETDKYTATKLIVNDATILVVSLKSYNIPEGLDPKNINDYKIIRTAETMQGTLITNDIQCSLKAEAIGLVSESLRFVENTEFNFVKTLDISFEDFSVVNNTPILEIDPMHTHENFNYLFTCQDTTQVKLGYIDGTGKVKVIGKELEKDLNNQSLAPLNSGQKFFSRAILDQSIDIVVCDSLAGSGKTAQALSSAMRLVGTNSPYDSIVYIRASVSDLEKEEEIGFLPGLEEKFAPYLHPINDSLEAIAKKMHSNTKLSGAELDTKVQETITNLIKKYHIQPMITLGLRGRTFSNSVVIIDEAQNMSKASLQKVLTRFGKHCKIIIIGSNRQIDHPYITKYNNGLSVLLEACTKPNELVSITAVSLNKVVRSNIAEFAELLFSKR